MLERSSVTLEGTNHAMNTGIQESLNIVGEDVWLTVPPFSEYLRTVRLVAADAAVRADLDCHEVEDFRIAVDELCHLLMSSTDHEIFLSFGVVGQCTVARGRARRRPGGPLAPLSELARAIIDSVATYYETIELDDEIRFSVMKHAR